MHERDCSAETGVARGAVGAPAPPRAVNKIFRPNLHEKCESAPPSQSKSQFLGQCLLGGLGLEAYLDGL